MTTEKTVVGKGTKYPLDGMLTFPDNMQGPVPAVVMVHGSGTSNMDEKVMKLTPFKDLAEDLAQNGVASLRYDKRTFVYAKQMKNVSPTVEAEVIEDAVLAAGLLKKDPRISKVYILGHSLGAMLAPRIDAEGADADGLIMLAASPYRLEEVVLRQLNRARSGSKPVMKWIVALEYGIFAKRFDGLYQMSDEEAKKKKYAGNVNLYYFKEMGQKTTVDYLLESSKPALILQGGKDFQVFPDDDYPKMKELLSSRDNTGFIFYPELNHLFVKGIYNDVLKAYKEYSVERRVDSAVAKDISEFIFSN